MAKGILNRRPDSVFVSIEPPAGTPDTNTYFQDWTGVALNIATDMPPEPEPTPTIDEVFSESLPLFIEASRWGRYISLGPASHIRDNAILVYYDPCPNFWDLYEQSKQIFRELGIRVVKRGETWLAHIPIKVLRDEVFIASGLAANEAALMEHTGMDPVAIRREIQQRQYQETQDGIKRLKRSRSQLHETVGDVVGLLAITAVSWAAYVVMGVSL